MKQNGGLTETELIAMQTARIRQVRREEEGLPILYPGLGEELERLQRMLRLAR